MKSPLWTQSLEEVESNPYDSPSHTLFLMESRKLLDALSPILDRHELKYHIDDQSLDKALWLLLNDGLDTLRDCVDLMEQQRHRLVGKMFRHLIESMDLVSYFHADTADSRKDLQKWFNDEVIPHRCYRDHLKNSNKQEEAEESKEEYSNLSRWSHHTYRTLLNSYSLGADNLLVYDSHYPKILTQPTTISQYLWVLGTIITKYLDLLEVTGFATGLELKNVKNVEAGQDEEK